MTWVRTVPEEEAKGALAESYERIRRSPSFAGLIPNIIKAFSQRPELLELISRTAGVATFGGSRLSRVQEEMLATAVSSLNRCHY